MSFFGFNTSLPRDRGHPSAGPGFSQPADPFAGFSRGSEVPDDGEGIDFDDTYDGLGDKLMETGDEDNDDTFGGGPIDKNFDFFGQTSEAAGVIEHEKPSGHMSQSYVPPSASLAAEISLSKPKKSGYDQYQDPDYIPALTVDSSIWGTQPKAESRQSEQAPPAVPTYMSLEEVEAQLRQQQAQQPMNDVERSLLASIQGGFQLPPGFPVHPSPYGDMYPGMPMPPHFMPPPPGGPMQILQNPNRQQQQLPPQHQQHQQHQRQPSQQQHQQEGQQQPRQHGQRGGKHRSTGSKQFAPTAILQNPAPVQLSKEEEAKRAKRNQKIFLMSKHNGFMTPQDKSFIGRVQLQQLITATGNPTEQSADTEITEDFYYQVYSQIHNKRSVRQGSGLAQTYLFQNGVRHPGRRARQADNHVSRMEQQVQRAVEAAKARPKQSQLIIEGSLGKISFSNAKTPKPLLNIKRSDRDKRASIGFGLSENGAGGYVNDRKSILGALEAIYDTLLLLEMHDRAENFQSFDAAEIMSSNGEIKALNERLWRDLKIMEPIIPGSTTPHPFIAILSHAKGKRAIPRIFRYLESQQKLTILTMLVVHLDSLDVVRLAQPQPNQTQIPAAVRADIDLFLTTVVPTLFKYINEVPMNMVLGLLSLILDRVDLIRVSHTKVGLVFLTTFVSRAELIKESGKAPEEDLAQWTELYGRLFDQLESIFGEIFPTSVNSVDDVYVWQFLAAMGAEANADQQIRLVSAVNVRVMDTVKQSRTLPPDLEVQKLANVNLFLNSMGIDVKQLI